MCIGWCILYPVILYIVSVSGSQRVVHIEGVHIVQIILKVNLYLCLLLLNTLLQNLLGFSKDLAPSCPKFIATQAPIPVTVNDFWVMVYEQGIEVVVMITSEYETGKVSH